MIHKLNFSNSQKYALLISIIFLIAVASHLRSLRNYYVLDDFRIILGNDFITKKANFNVLLDLGQFTNPLPAKNRARPLTLLSLMCDYSVWKYNPFGYHLTNLILHGINSAGVFILCILLAKDRKFKLELGVFAALSFALHPVAAETVDIASFRSDLLATFFYLGSLCCFINAFYSGSRIKVSFYYLFSFLFFLLAILSKEIALTLPLALLSCLFFFSKKDITKREALFISAFFCLLGLLFFVIFWIPRFTYSPNFIVFPNIENNISPLSSLPSYINTVLGSFLHNVTTLLLPVRLSIDYVLSMPKTAVNIQNISAIVLLLIFSGMFYFFKNVFLRFGISIFFITYLPVSNIAPLTNTINDRYLYLPSIGFCLVLAALINELPPLRLRNLVPVRLIAGICILLAYTIITVKRNPVFYDNFSLYSEAVVRAPKNIRVRYNFALSNLIKSNFSQAIDEFEEVSRLNPTYKRSIIWYFMGLCYQELGNFKMAKFYYTKAILLNPTSDAVSGFSYILSREGDDKGAGWLLQKGSDVFRDPYLFNDLGKYYAKKKLYNDAIKYFKKSLELKPNNPEFIRNLNDALERSKKNKR